MSNDEQLDLAAVFPADYEAWADRLYASIDQAVYLSLGIDPDAVEVSLDLDRAQVDVEFTVDSIELVHPSDSHMNLGTQEKEFFRRQDAVRQGLDSGTLQFSSPGRTDIFLTAFLTWANRLSWSMPSALVQLGVRQSSIANGIRPTGPRDETLERRKQYRSLALEIIAGNPALFKSSVAKAIAGRTSTGPGRTASQNTIYNVLFYSNDPVFAHDEWKSIVIDAKQAAAAGAMAAKTGKTVRKPLKIHESLNSSPFRKKGEIVEL